jgi:hypothetical protein
MRGLAWLAGSLALLRMQALRLLLIGLVLQFLTGFSQAGPLGFLFVLAIPALTAGVLQAMHTVAGGQRPQLMMLFSAFSVPARLLRLLVLALVMLAAGMLAAGALLSSSLAALDPEVLARLEQGDMSALKGADPELLRQMLLSLCLGIMASGAIGYFAIPLVWFRGLSASAALLTGLGALLRNVLPLLVLATCMTLLAMPVLALVAMLMSTGAASTVLTVLVLFLLVTYQLVMFGAQYLSFRELFGTGQPEDEQRPGDDQLLA